MVSVDVKPNVSFGGLGKDQLGVLALDCQRLSSLPPHGCSHLDLHKGADPWLPMLPLEPVQEWWSLTVSAAPQNPTGVRVLDCQCCPLGPYWCAGP